MELAIAIGVSRDPEIRTDCRQAVTALFADEPAQLGTCLLTRANLTREWKPAMSTTVTVAPDALVVEPTGLDKMWSLTRRIRIPLNHVRGATHDPGMKHAPKGWRGPGLRLGDKLSGTFHADGDRQFWNVDRYDNVIVIELTGEDYQRLVVSVDHPRDLVDAINAVVKDG